MQRIKKFLVVLTILATAVIFIKGPAWAAEVTRVHTPKGLVTINQGKDAGFTKGAEVCFFSDSGEKITCGRVHSTSANFAMVKVNNRAAKKIKYGMTARLMPATTQEKTE